MQLLKITSVPLEYEIHTEAARLEMKQAQNPSHVMTKNPSGWTMHARNIQVRMDTTELRASLNMRNSMDFARYYGSQGRQAAYQAVGEAVQFGNQMQQIQDGVSIGQIIRQRLLQQPETYTTFLPSAGTDISCSLPSWINSIIPVLWSLTGSYAESDELHSGQVPV